MHKRFSHFAAAASLLLLPLAGHAQTTVVAATDNANDPAYSNGYATGQNGGSGFGAFSVNSVGSAGTFVFTAAEGEGNNGTPKPSTIDTNGKSFGFFAQNSGTSVTITRGFNTGLQNANDSFALDFVPGYNDAGTSGVSLLNGNTRVGVFQYVAGTGFTFQGIPVANTSNNNSPNFVAGAIHLLYTVTAPGQFSLQSSGAVTSSETGTFSGPLSGFEVMATNSGATTPDHNGYFNNLQENLSPAPEPTGKGTLLVIGGLLGGMLLLRRRQLTRE